MTESKSFSFGFTVNSATSALKEHDASSSAPAKKQTKAKKDNKKRQDKEKETNVNNENENTNEQKQPITEITNTDTIRQLLDNNHLNANNATSFHDLQCQTALVIMQAYLEHPNLRRVFGIENDKNLFHFAQMNLQQLSKNGYDNRRFITVENIPGVKTVIAEKATQQQEAKAFQKGELVVAFHSFKNNEITKRESYHATIHNVHNDGVHYDVQFASNQQIISKIPREQIFKINTERTLEIVRGNLFERHDAFRADVILLPVTLPNESYRLLLIQGVELAPIGSRLLSFSKLELWEKYPTYSLRRLDYNIYDSDRFETNLMPFTKLYLYQRVLPLTSGNTPAEVSNKIQLNSVIRLRENNVYQPQPQWYTARVTFLDKNAGYIKCSKLIWEGPNDEEEVKFSEQRIRLIENRFKAGDIVHSYCPSVLEAENVQSRYNLYRGEILKVNDDGTYAVQFEDSETVSKLTDVFMFKPCVYKYNEGLNLFAWRYDIDPTSKLMMPCVVRHHNEDGSYRVEFNTRNFHVRYHDQFCEHWLSVPTEQQQKQFIPLLPLAYAIDYDKIIQWRPKIVSNWFETCGFEKTYCSKFEEFEINGASLLEIDEDILKNVLKIPPNIIVQMSYFLKALRNYYYGETNNVAQESIETINSSIEQYESLIIAQQKSANSLREQLKNFLDQDENKALKEYELQTQCVQLSKQNKTKEEIAQQLNKPMKWVTKYYQKDQKTLKPEIDADTLADLNENIKVIQNFKNQIEDIEKTLYEYSEKLQSEKSKLVDHN